MSQQDSNQQHDDPTSSSTESDKPKIVFAPGCFDNFEGTQAELDELIAEIHRMVETGEVFERAEAISDEEMDEILRGQSHEPRQ